MSDPSHGENPHEAAPVDLEQLAMISEGDAEFEKVLVDSFFQSVGESLEWLEAHSRNGDWQNCQRDAHKIKGSSATLGAEALQRLAMALEELPCDGETAQVPPMVQALREEYEKVRLFLERHLADAR